MHTANTELSYKLPSEFTSQSKFIEYFHQLPLETQLEMANANIPIAQRMVAAHFYDQKDFTTSQRWWHRAAENKDAVALLHQAEVAILIPDLEAVEQYYKSMLEAINEAVTN